MLGWGSHRGVWALPNTRTLRSILTLHMPKVAFKLHSTPSIPLRPLASHGTQPKSPRPPSKSQTPSWSKVYFPNKHETGEPLRQEPRKTHPALRIQGVLPFWRHLPQRLRAWGRKGLRFMWLRKLGLKGVLGSGLMKVQSTK